MKKIRILPVYLATITDCGGFAGNPLANKAVYLVKRGKKFLIFPIWGLPILECQQGEEISCLQTVFGVNAGLIETEEFESLEGRTKVYSIAPYRESAFHQSLPGQWFPLHSLPEYFQPDHPRDGYVPASALEVC